MSPWSAHHWRQRFAARTCILCRVLDAIVRPRFRSNSYYRRVPHEWRLEMDAYTRARLWLRDRAPLPALVFAVGCCTAAVLAVNLVFVVVASAR